MSEFDRQSKIFADKVKAPDITINAYSMMKTSDENGNDTVFWFLTGEDTMVMVDMRDDIPTTIKDEKEKNNG